MNKQAILYARVSTDEQADKGYSLPSQLDACRRYAERNGFDVVSEVKEDHSGATPIAQRPRGREVAAMLKSGKANVIIAYQIDRLSRDIVDLLATCREWIKAGIEIHACDMGKIESETDIVFVIRAWQGTDERKKIIERVTRGKRQKATSGRYVGTGKKPYGYRYTDGGELVIHPPEADIVRLMYEWYVNGDEPNKPLSANRIAYKLTAMGVTTPGEAGWNKHPTRPGLWDPTTILRMLSNETYAGVARFGKRRSNGQHNPSQNVIEISVPPIVTRKIWQAAQLQRERNVQMSLRNNKSHFYLLRGMVKCSCDASMIGRFKSKGQRRYYRCSKMSSTFRGLRPRNCNQRSPHSDELEGIVWKYAVEVMTADRELFEAKVREACEVENEALQPLRERFATVKDLLAEVEGEADQLATAMTRKSTGVVGKAMERQEHDINRRHKALTEEFDTLQAKLRAEEASIADLQDVLQYRDDTWDGMGDPTPENMRAVLGRLKTSVKVTNGKATISIRFAKGPRTFDLPTSQRSH